MSDHALTRAALNLIYPHSDDAVVTIGRAQGAEFTKFLERNRVPLAALSDSPQRRQLLTLDEFRDYDAREHHAKHRSLETYAAVAERWQAAGVRPMLIKSPGYFPYKSSNFDILVDRSEREAAVAVLDAMGFVELPHMREPFKHLFSPIREPDRSRLAMHIHTSVGWINEFFDPETLIQRARRLDDLWAWIPSPEDVLLITLAHAVYEDKEFSLRDLCHAGKAATSPLDVDHLRSVPRRFGWSRGYDIGLDLLRASAGAYAHPTTFPIRLPKVPTKAMHFAKSWSDERLSLLQRVGETALVGRFALAVKTRKLQRTRSVIVSISGPDGSGKTVTAKALTELLDGLAVPTEYEWVRLGSSPALDALKRLAGRGRGEGGTAGANGEVAAIPASRNSSPAVRSVWRAVLVGDLLTRLWGRVLLARLGGGVRVFDRYAYDAAVDLSTIYGMPFSDALVERAPAPDVAVLLKAPAEEAAGRGETPVSPEDAEKAHRLYDEMAGSFHLELDTSDGAELDLATVVREILRRTFATNGL